MTGSAERAGGVAAEAGRLRAAASALPASRQRRRGWNFGGRPALPHQGNGAAAEFRGRHTHEVDDDEGMPRCERRAGKQTHCSNTYG